MSNAKMVTAFAPASIGNLGVGFDMLGLAIEGAGDRVSARRVAGEGVSVSEVRGLDGELHPYLSTQADQNTASIAAAALWREHHVARTDHLYLLKSFSPAALENEGIIAGHRLTLRAIPWVIAGHEKHHLDILLQKYGIG